MNRLVLLAGAGCLIALGVAGVRNDVDASQEPMPASRGAESDAAPQTLEGMLRIHPKFHYRYSIHGFGDGQSCALFGADERLKSLEPGVRLRVRGRLASRYFGGDPTGRPIALVSTWVIYMDVTDVEVLTPGK